MQYFKLPQKILYFINKIQRDFIWGSSHRKKKIHYLSWKTITTPKHLGGLGLHDATSKNKSILSELAWRMFRLPRGQSHVSTVVTTSVLILLIPLLHGKIS